jgi:aryl-phospho-beta-D-glucosidase BglC (GH1 family)
MKLPLSQLRLIVGLVLLATALGAADSQTVGGVDTSRWHGFNLLEKFTLRGNAPFKEEDFKWIAELGFNFVRLPVDYRCYTEEGDWLKFQENVLREIDQAIAFGEKYGIHVCLNLHRAPGYCINPPAEPRDLWTDPAALDAFVAHWTMFARRYRDIPAARLSFNLLNEPTRNTREAYLRVNRRAIEAIHAVDPRRLIIVDGNSVGRDPTPEFVAYDQVVQATRGYTPSVISHYKASWMKGADTWPEPTWPLPTLAGHLYGPTKPELRSPLVLQGDFPAGTTFILAVAQVSVKAKVRATTDGATIAETVFDPGADPGKWLAVKSDAKWVFHRPALPMALSLTLPRTAREVAFQCMDGDWLEFATLSVQRPGAVARITGTDSTWGVRQTAHAVTASGALLPPEGVAPNQSLVDYLKPWREMAARGETVFVGEWGCHNRTPHPVALAWMRSWLDLWREARFGWAVWNFRGSFGVLDSGRTDVAYEDWHGHKLDREMLTLLQQYAH